MLEDEMEINKLEEENRELRNRIKELEEELNYSRCNNNHSNIRTNSLSNNHSHIHNLNLATDKLEDKPLTYEQWLETEEGDNLANAYAEAININISEEAI